MQRRRTFRARPSTGLAAGLALLLTLAIVPSGSPAAAAPLPAVRFGMDMDSIAEQAAAGVAPDYAMLWVGPWTLQHGWGGVDAKLADAAARGVTPVVQLYYWGDDISPWCVTYGCWSSLHSAWKDRAGWDRLAAELVEHLAGQLAGKPAVVVLETEFNKGGAPAPLRGPRRWAV